MNIIVAESSGLHRDQRPIREGIGKERPRRASTLIRTEGILVGEPPRQSELNKANAFQ
jgi:hypothetical protein